MLMKRIPKNRKTLALLVAGGLVLCVALIAGPVAGALTALGVAPMLLSVACLVPCLLPVLLLRKKGGADSAATTSCCGTQERQAGQSSDAACCGSGR